MSFVISMKFFSKFRMLAMLAVALMTVGTRAGAQVSNGIAYYLSGTPDPVGLNSNLTYTIDLTNNLSGALQFVFVTNTLDAHSTFVDATIVTNTLSIGSTTTNGNVVIFSLNQFGSGGFAHMTVIVQPTAIGRITNAVTFNINNVTNFFVNIINSVTSSAAPAQADLAVGMTGPATLVFSNDWMVYGVNVTNLGPSNAPNVMLTNTLPTNVVYKSVSPSNQSFTVSVQKTNVIFNLGTLTNGAFRNFQLTVQPTNAGTWTFVSVVGTNGIFDPNLANNSASINVVVSNFLSNPGQLTATIVSTQKYSQLSGRLEQSIVLSNAGPTSVDAARVIVTGLTNRLSNAVGTNNGNPFVTYAAPLAAGNSDYLLLQFYPNQIAFPFTNSQLQAVGVIPPDLTPATGLIPTNIAFIGKLPSGGMVLTFSSLTNRTYTVEYTSNLLSTYSVTNYIADTNNPGVTNIVVSTNSIFSTNWLAAQPSTLTPANYTYWIDYGPPETVSHPANTPMRFYRVFLNP